MPTFIKTGLWEKVKKGYNGWLNLDELIQKLIPASDLSPNEVLAIQNTPSPASAMNPFATINDIPVNGVKYYSVFVSQTSTSAPTILPLINTLGIVGISRTGIGVYTFVSTGLFIENKTTPNQLNTIYDTAGNKTTIKWTNANVITLKTYNSSDVLTDGILNEQEVNIKVFI